MPIAPYAATALRHPRGYTVTVDGLRVSGKPVQGEGFTRDAAAVDAKRKLAQYLGKAPHELTLILSGDA